MKIPASITPIQPFQHTTGTASNTAKPGDADQSVRFGAPKGLHPENPAVGLSSELLSKFRDPSALANRSDSRQDGVAALKQQIGKQFGPDLANAIFNQPGSNGQAGPLPHDFPPQSFRADF